MDEDFAIDFVLLDLSNELGKQVERVDSRSDAGMVLEKVIKSFVVDSEKLQVVA